MLDTKEGMVFTVKKKNGSSEGTIIIETSIVLFMFIMLHLFVFGLFSIVSAQNQVTHALIQATKSLSLDPYMTEHVDSLSEADTFWSSFGGLVLDFARSTSDEHFSSSSDWYTVATGNATLAKDRFVGFFAGGSETDADVKLKELGVVSGLNGIHFSMEIVGDDVKITAKYKIQFWFDAFGAGEIPMEQTITARLWK